MRWQSLTIDCLDELHRQIETAGFRIAALAGSAFWHSFCGVDANGKPTLPILHLLDTRSGDQVSKVPDAHERTGCVPHSSYWPAKLLWLAPIAPRMNSAPPIDCLSFPEYLFLKLFGSPGASTSMVSATGLWNQNAIELRRETLAALPIRREQLAIPHRSMARRPVRCPNLRHRGPNSQGPLVSGAGRWRLQQHRQRMHLAPIASP